MIRSYLSLLSLISPDRFIFIKDPLRYSRHLTKKTVAVVIGVVWLLSGLVSFLPISLGWHKPSAKHGSAPQLFYKHSQSLAKSPPNFQSYLRTWSDSDVVPRKEPSLEPSFGPTLSPSSGPSFGPSLGPSFESNFGSSFDSDVSDYITNYAIQSETSEPQCALDLTPTYAIVSSMISFYLPCLMMCTIYYKLFSICQKHVKTIKAMTMPYPAQGCPPHHHVTDHKAAVTLGVIMGSFLACWLPFFAMNIVAPFYDIPDLVFKILTWLGYFNSSLNPLIYSIFNSEFREAFRKILVTHVMRTEGEGCCRRDRRQSNARLRNSSPRAQQSHVVAKGQSFKGRLDTDEALKPNRDTIELGVTLDGKISAI